MSKTANEQRALLTQKQQEADQAMEMIQKSMEGTVEKRREVEHLQLKLGKEEIEMTKQKAQVEEELRGEPTGARRGEAGRRRHQEGQSERDPISEDAARGHPRRARGRPQNHGQL